MATIWKKEFKNSKGKDEVRYLARVRRKGHKPVSKTFKRKGDADKWARDIESEMDKGVFVSREEAEGTTLTEAIDRYIKEYIQTRLKHPKRETDRANAIRSRDISKLFLARIRGKEIAAFIKEREKEGVSGNTIRLDLALLSKLFEVARRDWGMESLVNPTKLVHKPKAGQGRTRRLEKGEEESLLEKAADRFKPVVLFALETAMRRAEIAGLDWGDVDLKGSSIYLGETKNYEERTIPLSPRAKDILKGLPRNISGSVFGLSADQITGYMRRTVKTAKLHDLRFHDLRHEATSRLFENTDLDTMEIKMISGHKSMQMLARYSHLRANRLAERLAGAKR
ncbi:Site-specific recombinase XerD [Pseudodesulfovibrio profundus]|uniref:Site-specific recombinase XerD n=1 Tax=Pseudodesulfovibrio profundus TaxID=57320 RepID=A0A2C8F3K7_9BACT|nr:site-specific integrase [Pseudodesulfovibrio profundus]SOB56995.1 Site-specific recombinase XerD [Pseudodesulfovibrio profundus]